LILLDENILEGQRLQLGAWGIAARQIGVDVGRKGMQDEEIVVLLRRLRHASASGIKFWQIRKQRESHVSWAIPFEAQPGVTDSD
jgi:hypothetical protein